MLGQRLQHLLVFVVRTDPEPDDLVARNDDANRAVAASYASRNKAVGTMDMFEVQLWDVEDSSETVGRLREPANVFQSAVLRAVRETRERYATSQRFRIKRSCSSATVILKRFVRHALDHLGRLRE